LKRGFSVVVWRYDDVDVLIEGDEEALLHPKANLRHEWNSCPSRSLWKPCGEVKIPTDWRSWNPTSRKEREKWGTHFQ
jgi:hypothetical protein